ncbi:MULTISPECIES: FAD-dependent oxidoreductase [unclassified Roseitalea]|uniref:NAD(P)/FAD-dependent oxidoreductase n=1 Tax=unclassified Roseitalea TaxID=2639107 RepID=UPI00273EC0A6|nr:MULTISPECIES: FAD-dependent oxidoreductase [unclassified Roseitalea]
METFVIIGAGECGVRAALTLREAGFAGRVCLFGDERHAPYERPPLSKTFPPEVKPIVPPETLTEAGIELMLGARAVALDPVERAVRFDDDSMARYDRLLLATGATARTLPGFESALTLRTLDDARRIADAIVPGARLAIVGGGVLGMELAATARIRGAEVTVYEAGDALMGRAVPEPIAAILEARHIEAGVRIVKNADVTGASSHEIRTGDGACQTFDLVVCAVGAVPATDLAETAGLDIDNGIAVDAHFRTSARNVFAAGDCCAFAWRGAIVRLESWRAAQDQGAHAARAMLGDLTPYGTVPWFWSDQYELTLQVAGLYRAGWPYTRRAAGANGLLLFQHDEHGAPISVSGVGEGNSVARDVKLGERLIERDIRVDPAQLADPAVGLKTLLRR